jgi:hypothetical protein
MRFRMRLVTGAGVGALAAALVMGPNVAAGASTAQVKEASNITAATQSVGAVMLDPGTDRRRNRAGSGIIGRGIGR